MLFGDRVESASSAAPAEWIADACRGVWGTVGALVPNHYPLLLRVDAPDPSVEDWWSAYRDLFQVIASTGESYTSTPDRGWFAIWEGHGFDADPAIGVALRQISRFDLPHRTYYLLAASVDAATQLVRPGSSSDWCHPDLFWPGDRRWFVATDVDFWAVYVGGDEDFVTELARCVPTPTEAVSLDHHLEPEA